MLVFVIVKKAIIKRHLASFHIFLAPLSDCFLSLWSATAVRGLEQISLKVFRYLCFGGNGVTGKAKGVMLRVTAVA